MLFFCLRTTGGTLLLWTIGSPNLDRLTSTSSKSIPRPCLTMFKHTELYDKWIWTSFSLMRMPLAEKQRTHPDRFMLSKNVCKPYIITKAHSAINPRRTGRLSYMRVAATIRRCIGPHTIWVVVIQSHLSAPHVLPSLISFAFCHRLSLLLSPALFFFSRTMRSIVLLN